MTGSINLVVTNALTNVNSLLSGSVGTVIATLLALTILGFIVVYIRGLFRGA